MRRSSRTLLARLVRRLERAAPIGHEILAQHDERACRHGAGERLWNRHLADVAVDRPVEGHVLGQRVHEHQGVVDVRANDRLFGARLRQAETPFSRGLELMPENPVRKQVRRRKANMMRLESMSPNRGTTGSGFSHRARCTEF